MLRRVLVPIVLALLVVPVLAPVGPVAASGPTIAHATVVSFDNTAIAITIFKPENASAANPVPVVLRSHGWAGSRDKTVSSGGIVERLLAEGYGVVTFDARGHGESGGVARIHDMDYEIKDVSRIIDLIATLPWVKLDAAGDPRLGGSGGSYGGGWQLLAASVDPRIDAIVPEITWNNLVRSLAPNEAVKSTWVHALYGAGKARARLAPEIDQWYQHAMLRNEIPDEARVQLTDNSPGTHLASVNAPTLLVQGMMDTLFNLNEAADTFEGLRARGVPTALLSHNREHADLQVNIESQRPGLARNPCGDVADAAVAWYDRHLKGDLAAPAPTGIALALDDNGCVRAPYFGAIPRSTLLAAEAAIVAPSILLPLYVPSGARVAGIPHVEFTHPNMCVSFTVYASLVAVGPEGPRTLNAQVRPYRSVSDPMEPCTRQALRPVAMDLGGVGGALRRGETLALRLDLENEHFATNGERPPLPVPLLDVVVDLPLAPSS